MNIFKVFWKSNTKPGTWIAFEAHPLNQLLMFTYSRNGYAKQWFLFMNIFPLAILKDNSTFTIGLSLVKYFIGINFHLNFKIGELSKRRREIEISFVPFEKEYEFNLNKQYV